MTRDERINTTKDLLHSIEIRLGRNDEGEIAPITQDLASLWTAKQRWQQRSPGAASLLRGKALAWMIFLGAALYVLLVGIRP